MIPLPPAELTLLKAPIVDKKALRAKIESILTSYLNAAEPGSGARILIKPSALLLDRDHRDNHLQTLKILIETLRAHAAVVSIGDSPDAMLAPTGEYWSKSGLAVLAELTGCALFNFEAARSSAVMVDSRVYYLPDSLKEFDIIINAAWLGLDQNGNLSGVIENCLGFLPGRQIEAWEKAVAAVDLYAVVAPQLHLLQFEIGCDSYLVFGDDGVALDTAIFSRVKGKSLPKSVTLAAEAGLGIGHVEMITISGAAPPESFDASFESLILRGPATSFLERFSSINVLSVESVVADEKCDGCARCCEVCPTGSIRISEGKAPFWNQSLCIGCWCCREQCPSSAISLRISG